VDVTIALQNIGHGAGRLDPHPEIPEALHGADRWPLLVERLRRCDPDVLVLNEICGWTEKRLASAAADLGMKAVGITPSRSSYPTGFLYNPDRLELAHWNTDHAHAFHHGAAIAAFNVDGLAGPLTVAGGHIAPFAWRAACDEVSTLVYRAYRYGPYAVCAADFNFSPLQGIAPDRSKMLPYNRMVRLERPADPASPPRLDIAQTLRDGDFFDAAAEMWMRTADKSYLAYTCPSDRIDWIAVAEALKPALTGYRLLDQPEWASDHHGVTITLETQDAAPAAWQYC
jgi:endonuclease/exonuclease/phosphatase family metal-dependent hydrolase